MGPALLFLSPDVWWRSLSCVEMKKQKQEKFASAWWSFPIATRDGNAATFRSRIRRNAAVNGARLGPQFIRQFTSDERPSRRSFDLVTAAATAAAATATTAASHVFRAAIPDAADGSFGHAAAGQRQQ